MVVGYAKPNKKHENLGGATKPVQKSFGWQLILAHTHEELKLNGGGVAHPSPNALNTDHPHLQSNLGDLKNLHNFGCLVWGFWKWVLISTNWISLVGKFQRLFFDFGLTLWNFIGLEELDNFPRFNTLELHWTWRTRQLPQIQTLWNFIGLEELDNFLKFNTFRVSVWSLKLDNFPKFKHFQTSLDLKNSTTSSNSTLSSFSLEPWNLTTFPQIQTLSFSHNQCQSSSLVFHREENPTEEDPRGFN